MKHWYSMAVNTAEPTVAEVHIIDFIGSWDDDWFARNFGYEMGVTARAFIEELAKLPAAVKTINVHINSPGGDVQGGINIANALREQQASKGRTVETFVDGIAASIASVIAMAGSKVHIADNALMMVHNPYCITVGNAAEMRKVADILDTMRGQIINTYKWHSALEPEALAALMDAETWLDADAAIANGLATDKIEGLKAAASIDAKAMATLKVPEQFAARVKDLVKVAPAPVDPPKAAAAADVLRICREGECLELAETLLAANATLPDVQARVAAEKTTRTAATTRATQISTLCATNKLPNLAKGYIAGAMSIDAVKEHLLEITAKVAGPEIDGSLEPDKGVPGKKAINRTEIFNRFNKPTAAFGG